MKARRAELKQEFVPVIVTLESQEEMDSLYAMGNHTVIGSALPALDRWYRQLSPFVTDNQQQLWDRLNSIID